MRPLRTREKKDPQINLGAKHGYKPVTWVTDYAKNMGNTFRYNRLPKKEGILCLGKKPVLCKKEQNS